jgi:hypothetical protein
LSRLRIQSNEIWVYSQSPSLILIKNSQNSAILLDAGGEISIPFMSCSQSSTIASILVVAANFWPNGNTFSVATQNKAIDDDGVRRGAQHHLTRTLLSHPLCQSQKVGESLGILFLETVLHSDSTSETNFEADREVPSDAKCLPAAPRRSLQFGLETSDIFGSENGFRSAICGYAAVERDRWLFSGPANKEIGKIFWI